MPATSSFQIPPQTGTIHPTPPSRGWQLIYCAHHPSEAPSRNFYLKLVDAQLRHPTDEPSIGIILCKSRDRLVVEYALSDMTKPIGVSEYSHNVVPSLPEPLRESLPSVEELEAELGRAADNMQAGVEGVDGTENK